MLKRCSDDFFVLHFSPHQKKEFGIFDRCQPQNLIGEILKC
jgi:hypothetical protein